LVLTKLPKTSGALSHVQKKRRSITASTYLVLEMSKRSKFILYKSSQS